MGEDDKRRDGESGQRPFEENRGSRPRCLTPRCKWSGRRRVGRRWRRSVRHWLGSLLLVLDTSQDSSRVGSPMSPVRVTRKPTGWFSAAASYQRRVESSACTPRRSAQSFIISSRRSNKSDRAYAASTLFCTTCTSAASMTSRGWSVCSADQSRNDDRKPWATAAILFSLEHLRQRRRRDSFRDALAHARGVIAREGGNVIPASVPSMPTSASSCGTTPRQAFAAHGSRALVVLQPAGRHGSRYWRGESPVVSHGPRSAACSSSGRAACRPDRPAPPSARRE